jgi:hypothetical protein
MANQSGATLFDRVFEVSELPIPPDEEYGELAEEVRADPATDAFHHDFHYALIDRAGLNDEEAWAEQQSMALHAIWTYPRAYWSDTPSLFADSVAHFRYFVGRAKLEDELDRTDPPYPTALNTGLWDAARAINDVWWVLALHGLAGLLVLFVGDRRSRAAGAALLSVWLTIVLGTVLAQGGDWRYTMQVAPLAWMLGSAGVAILARAVVQLLRRERSLA